MVGIGTLKDRRAALEVALEGAEIVLRIPADSPVSTEVRASALEHRRALG